MENKVRETNLILPAAHGQLEKTNLGWPDLAFGMSSGASAVYGWIRLGELVPTNEFSRPHLLWHAGIFKKNSKKPPKTLKSPHSYPRIGGSMVRVRGSPERDILSLRTLGLGLARFGRPSAGASRPPF